MSNKEEIMNTTKEINIILEKLKDELFSKIGNSGNIWTGDAAVIASTTFETLNTKFNMYEQKLKKFIEKDGE